LEKDIKDVVYEWVNKLSKRRKEIGGLSLCPFSMKAMVENKVFWYDMEGDSEVYIESCLSKLFDFEVAIFFDTKKELTDEDLSRIITNLNKKREDLIFLKSHPDKPGYIQGISTGNEIYPAILVQPKYKLLMARRLLKKTKYYDFWDEEYKNEIWGYGNEL
jgi:hypothetical protein